VRAEGSGVAADALAKTPNKVGVGKPVLEYKKLSVYEFPAVAAKVW
jgi:hypothetical protein